MKILITGGGTGGHINPALAIGTHIRKTKPGWDVKFAGNPDRMEGKLVPAAGFELLPIVVDGLSRSFKFQSILRNIKSIHTALKARHTADKMLKSFQPDLVIGVGGYVTWPTVASAAKRGIKTMIHEQNAFPGITTKMLASKVDVVLLPNEAAGNRLKNMKKSVVVGNPIRDEFFALSRSEARKQIGISDDDFFIVSASGSLGARVFNQKMNELLGMSNDLPHCRFYHGTGKEAFSGFTQGLGSKGVSFNHPDGKIQIVEFITNMPTALNAADLVISRAGASTLAEIAACGVPSILIPSPNVTENHQYHNAMVFSDKGGAIVITEEHLTSELLHETIQTLVNDKARLQQMRKAAQSLAAYDVGAKIFEQIRLLLQKSN